MKEEPVSGTRHTKKKRDWKRKWRAWTVDDPEVQAIFAGVYASDKGSVYYRVGDDGHHHFVKLYEQLLAFGMHRKAAAALIREAIARGLIHRGALRA
jgi:hypothetical protein